MYTNGHELKCLFSTDKCKSVWSTVLLIPNFELKSTRKTSRILIFSFDNVGVSNNMKIATDTYDKTYQEYSDSLAWMNEIGVEIGKGRTNHYAKMLRHWKDQYKIASDHEAKKIFPDFVSSISEIEDFIAIHKAFDNIPVSSLASIVLKLNKAVNGPIHAVDETPKTTAARNFLFEATSAARFHRPHRGVNAILDAGSDTGILIDNKKIWIECKRITTIGKIGSNVKDASSQLESVFKKQTGSGHRGLVALDVSKIINKGDNIMVTENDTELSRSINGKLDLFIKEQSKTWENIYKRRSRKIIGTIVRISLMATSEARNLLVHTSNWGTNPRIGIAASDDKILRVLNTRLDEV